MFCTAIDRMANNSWATVWYIHLHNSYACTVTDSAMVIAYEYILIQIKNILDKIYYKL